MFNLNSKVLVAVAVALGMSSVNAATQNEMQEAVKNARQETQISTTYALSPYLRMHDLDVTVVNGRALISGYVREEVEKELAVAIASGVDGVTSIDNRIVVDSNYEVTKPKETRRYVDVVSDAEINAAIKSKLIWSKHADGMDLTVTTTSGHVVLTGNVATQQTKNLAEKLSRDTQGVNSVDNRIEISDSAVNGEKYGSPASKGTTKEENTVIADSWITTKVKSSLLYSRNVSGFDIGVNTTKGVVTLDGRVSNGAEKALAIELSEQVRGVKKVNSGKLVF